MFRYSKAKVENGSLVLTETKEVNQSELTSNCWLVQINGLEACKTCEYKNTKDCGGGKSLKKLLKTR